MVSLYGTMLPIVLLAALGFATVPKPTAGWLSGKTVTCDAEGQSFHVPFIAGDPCIKCSCSGGEVVCERNMCEATSGCHVLLFSGSNKHAQQGTCCDVCKGCRAGGQTLVSGQTAISRQDVCERSQCLASVLTISRASCHVSCKSATFIPGRCCPTCPGCEHDGVQHANGATFSLKADPCVSCTCQDGRTSCERMACPVLNCPDSAIVQPPGQCCPICQGKRKVFDLAQACLFRSKTYRHGQEADADDECTRCSCENGTMVCRRQAACDRDQCSEAVDSSVPAIGSTSRGGCCSKCGQLAPPAQPCAFDGVVREHGATWESHCASCKCDNGTTECTRMPCPGAAVIGRCDPATHEWKYLRDECCPTCVERSGVCSVFGDSHFKALDGEVRSFHSACKYVLAKECGGGGADFSVIVSNQAHYGSPSKWMKSVLLSTRNGSRVRLFRSGEVRVDRRSVRLPYKRTAAAAPAASAETLAIWRDEDDNIVAEQGGDQGIRVVWDAEGYLEVHVPAAYRGRTCGLCSGRGDATVAAASAAEDERAERANADAAALATAALSPSVKASGFGQTDGSARFESDDGCAASAAAIVPAATHVGQLQQCQDSVARWRRAHQECSFLKSSMFASCGSKVPVAPYYSACVADSCNCPKHRLCACDSLTAYERACERAGYSGRRSVVSECRNRVKKARLRSRS